MALGSKQYIYKIWKVRLGIGLLVVVCVFLALSVFERYTVEREMAARRDIVEAEVTALQVRYDALKAEVEYLRDDRSLEAEIRKRFDVAREGESVVILTGDSAPQAATSTAVFIEESSPWWQFWR